MGLKNMGGTKDCQELKDIGPTVLTVHEENAMGLVWNLGDRNAAVCNGGDVQYQTPKEVSQIEMSIPRTRLLVPLLTQHTKAGTRKDAIGRTGFTSGRQIPSHPDETDLRQASAGYV